MADEYDLKILGGDMAFGPDDEPLCLSGADVIAQDVQHRLRASGLVEDLIADEGSLNPALERMAGAVEDDERIKPGTARATQEAGTVTVTAKTMDAGTISQTVGT